VALLDGFLTFFIVLALWFLALDRRTMRERWAAREPRESTWGPLFWNRPWLLATGVAAGGATAVKWSGLYVIAGIGIYVVITDAL
ncbi:phospholipid carrier-dependent glycosyltransferase, partial [Streptomyces brasiliscabiei]|uniref:phospholipid carrier-dependent glycosyltransferase n=2 Tax=Bacteria TaxID=2 RepID=UPI0030157331